MQASPQPLQDQMSSHPGYYSPEEVIQQYMSLMQQLTHVLQWIDLIQFQMKLNPPILPTQWHLYSKAPPSQDPQLMIPEDDDHYPQQVESNALIQVDLKDAFNGKSAVEPPAQVGTTKDSE